MNTGKTLFAQLMEFLPWKTFGRIVARYDGDDRARTLSCGEQYRAMAFAQLTYRESLRDIEACLSVQASKLYHMGFSEPVRRSTLADANESRDWRIYADLAQRLIRQARRLYAKEDFGLDLTNTVYALDSTTIDLCLSVFPWAHFRTTKAAVKMHTLLDLRGNIPSFIYVSDGKLADVHALDLLVVEPGSIYVMDRGYIDFSRLHAMHQAGAFFVTRGKSNMKAHRLYSASTERPTGIMSDQTIALDGYYARQHYPAHPLQGRRDWQDVSLSDQQLRASGIDHRGPLQKSLAGGAIFQMDQAAPADQAVLRDLGECGEDADMDRRFGLRAGRDHQEAARSGGVALHINAGHFGHNI
jgi:Domain of unknown function (DUF4372)/Transposase DDE domain